MALSTTTTTPTGWAADAAYANYQRAQGIAARPFTPYAGNMLAGWNEGQATGYNSIMNGAGVGLGAMQQAQGAALSAAQAGPQQVQGAGYNPAMQGVMNTHAANAGNATPWTVMNTHAANAGPAAQMAAASAGPAAQMQAAQMGRGDVRNVQAGQFPGANLGQYMNPYISNVVDTTLGQLGRQNDIIQNQTNARAAAAGAFGGGRQAVMNAENNRAFLDTAANTTANLYNQGFNQAQNAIQTDQNRALQADLANQSADWNVGQANLANRQNSALQNMLAGNNMAQFNAGNVQAANLQNMGALNSMAQYNASNQQQASRDTSAAHNSAAAQQAANANQMAQYNASNQQSAYNQTAQAHNAALANQAAAANRALEFGADVDLRGQLANQSAYQNNINSRITAANGLNGMGMDEQTRAFNAAQAQYNMGENRTAFDQTAMNEQYRQWAEAQGYDRNQLAYLQSALSGAPMGQSTVSPYYNNTAANVLAGGIGAGQLLANAPQMISGAKGLWNAGASLLDSWF
jgi:hypothetical protein